jgi:hypothetical protein
VRSNRLEKYFHEQHQSPSSVQLDQGHSHPHAEIAASQYCNALAETAGAEYFHAKRHIFLNHESLDEQGQLIDHHTALGNGPFPAIEESLLLPAESSYLSPNEIVLSWQISSTFYHSNIDPLEDSCENTM